MIDDLSSVVGDEAHGRRGDDQERKSRDVEVYIRLGIGDDCPHHLPGGCFLLCLTSRIVELLEKVPIEQWGLFTGLYIHKEVPVPQQGDVRCYLCDPVIEDPIEYDRDDTPRCCCPQPWMARLFRRAGFGTSGNNSSTGGSVRVCARVSKLIVGSLDGGGGVQTMDWAAILVELEAGK